MKLMKRAAAAALALVTALSVTACGENTANAMNVDGYDVRAGIYLYYATSAYNEAIQTMRDGGETFENCEESKDYKKILDKSDIDGITAEQWIQDKAAEYCETFVQIERDFDRLGLTLTGEEIAAVESSAESSLTFYGDFFKETGIGEQTIKDIVRNSYKQNAIWEAYYGEGGSEGVEEEELYNFYRDNHLRIKYIEMPLKDGEGNLLKADGKAEIEKMAEDYLTRLAKKQSSEAELMNEFDFLIDEHNHYVTSLSEAAVTTTDEEGNTVTTETTAKVTTDKNGSTGETTTGTDETDETKTTAETTSAAETTETTAETTAAAETDETGEVTTAPDETTAPAETTTTTAAAPDTTDAETTQTVGDETTDTTTATTTTAVTYSFDYEKTLLVSTTGTDAAKPDETTTEPSYTPCEKVYTWAADPDTELLKPELIKDDECYYIAVKMDIEERMTPDDLWSESAIENVRQELYYDAFLDKLDEAAKKLPVQRNEKAFRRYNVLDIDIIAYQNALMQSMYSRYGMSQ